MEKSKKKSVGIQLLGKTKEGLVAILQVRAKWNTEKNSPESWPGACQVTAHGKLEEGENFLEALSREIKEELGDEIVSVIQNLSDTGNLVELINLNIPEKQVITYGAIVENDVCQMLNNKKVNDSFGGFRMIKREDINKIVDLGKIDKKIGVTDETIAMFSDEKEAVRLAFDKFS